MNLATIIAEGTRLEAARRLPPLDDKGCSLDWDAADAAWQLWLRKHGWLLVSELGKRL